MECKLQYCYKYFDVHFLFQCSVSGSPITPPLDNYTICINNQCSVYVTDSCLVSIPANFTTSYNITVSLNNVVGSSGPSPTTNISKSKKNMISFNVIFCSVDTTLLRSVMVTDVKMTSASISYSTFQGCFYFPTNTNVTLELVNFNTSMSISVNPKKYLANNSSSFDLELLNASTFYNYSAQVFVGNNINSGMKIGTNIEGQFKTTDFDNIEDTTSTMSGKNY